MCRMHAHPTPPPAAASTASRRCGRPGRAGFSLIEVLTLLVVTSIGLVLGIPSYRILTERAQAGAALHLLASHLASARHTAIAYRTPTVVCPSDGAGGCRTDGDWSLGWLMYFDRDGKQRPDRRANLLREETNPIRPPLRMLGSRGHKQLRFQPDGRSMGSNLSIRVCRDDQLLGKLVVNISGRARTFRPRTSTPCMS